MKEISMHTNVAKQDQEKRTRRCCFVVVCRLLPLFAIFSGHVRKVKAVSMTKPVIQYRTGKSSDIPGISSLLMDTFEEDEIPAWDILSRTLADQRYKKQLRRRLEDLVHNPNTRHSWIVASTKDTGDVGMEVVGFMELGTMPSPIPIVTVWEGVETSARPESPFLANLAVAKASRRQQIATTLVQLAIKIAQKWSNDENNTTDDKGRDPPLFDQDSEASSSSSSSSSSSIERSNLYLAVDRDNEAAIGLYDRLEFRRVLDEIEQLSPQAFRKLKRPPRLYFEKELSSS